MKNDDGLDAVLDTSVLIAALRSRNGASFELLKRVGHSGWRLHISTALLLEYQEVAIREAAAMWARPELVEAIIDFIAGAAQEHGIKFRWRPFLRDPDDDFIVELAVAAGARYIITHDLKDFADVQSLGIQALTPAEFLRLLNTSLQ